jgi:Arc/MetJ-type ribon-helix-helix transcriptional regulator
MPAAKRPSAPLTFDLPESLIGKIERCRKGHALTTASEVVRLALAKVDLDRYNPERDPHLQISVRIPAQQRTALKRTARVKDSSIGELIRHALESLPEKPSKSSR